MAELYGIAVINDSEASSASDEIGIGITAIVRIKHAALYEAAKILGSNSALARHLGISGAMVGDWINLKSCPPKDAVSSEAVGSAAKFWTDERIAVMEAKLLELTGKTWEELWPDALRENHDFLKAPKQIEQIYNWRQSAMLSYAEATRQRMLEQYGPADGTDDSPLQLQKEAVEESLHMLTLRQRKVLAMKFGIGMNPCTYEEAGNKLGITRERVRQIEAKALEKLRYLAGLSLMKSSPPDADSADDDN